MLNCSWERALPFFTYDVWTILGPNCKDLLCLLASHSASCSASQQVSLLLKSGPVGLSDCPRPTRAPNWLKTAKNLQASQLAASIRWTPFSSTFEWTCFRFQRQLWKIMDSRIVTVCVGCVCHLGSLWRSRRSLRWRVNGHPDSRHKQA